MCVQQQQRQQQQVVRVTSVRIVCDDPIRPPIREREPAHTEHNTVVLYGRFL